MSVVARAIFICEVRSSCICKRLERERDCASECLRLLDGAGDHCDARPKVLSRWEDKEEGCEASETGESRSELDSRDAILADLRVAVYAFGRGMMNQKWRN